MRIVYSVCIILLLTIVSCKGENQKSRGAIVLGDSTMILTETNPDYLTDYVADIKATKTEDTTVTKQIADTALRVAPIEKADTLNEAPKAVQASLPKNGKGLQLEFSEVTVTIPNIDTKSFKNQNLKTLNGVSYQLASGTLQGNQLVIKGATIQKVSQRYITTLAVTKDQKTLELGDMDQTTPWSTLNGNKGVYPIKGIEPSQLLYKKTNVGAIRNAVTKAARAERMSRSEVAEWEKAVRNLKSPTQAPVSVMLQSVMWRVEGKDSKGRSFRKEIRIDMPI